MSATEVGPASPNLSAAGLDLPGVEFTATSLALTEDVTAEEFTRLLGLLEHFQNASPWWVGDLLVDGEERWGDRVFQMLDEIPWKHATRQRRFRVSMRVAESVREPDLSWSHHHAVSVLDSPMDQAAWLARALAEGWSSGELSGRISTDEEVQASREKQADPTSIFEWTAKYRRGAKTLIPILRERAEGQQNASPTAYGQALSELAADIESSLE